MINCKNCGAPLHGSRCEFCGTEYPVNVAYDNKVTINVQGLAFPTVGELCKAISEQQTITGRTNKPMTKAEIMAIKDTATRRRAIAEYFGMSGI